MVKLKIYKKSINKNCLTNSEGSWKRNQSKYYILPIWQEQGFVSKKSNKNIESINYIDYILPLPLEIKVDWLDFFDELREQVREGDWHTLTEAVADPSLGWTAKLEWIDDFCYKIG